MGHHSVLPFVLLLAVGFGGVVVLVADAAGWTPQNRWGTASAAAFPLLIGALVLVAGWTVAALLDIVAEFHPGAAAIVVLTSFGAASAAANVRLFFIEPKLMDVLRDRSKFKSYIRPRWKWVLAKTAFAWIAIYGTALLVFGSRALSEFIEGKVESALHALGL